MALVLKNVSRALTMVPTAEQPNILGGVDHAAIAIDGDKIAWVGEESQLPSAYRGEKVLEVGGRLVSPGLIDCHTHLVFAGNRSGEFAMRAAGKKYADIAAAGGGILSTVMATRAASPAALTSGAEHRLRRFLSYGVTTVEAKSGYGLNLETELKILQVARDLNQRGPVEIVNTFMAAHAVPQELRNRADGADAYLDTVIDDMLPAVTATNLALFCDIFVEKGFFSADHARRLAVAAKQRGLRVKLHVDQLSDGDGAALAAELGAVSADHLDHASDTGLKALAHSGTVGVLLPGAAVYLGDPLPSAARFLSAGVRIALSTDCNPGTSPTENLPLMMTMACAGMGMTIEHAWESVTVNAAAAIARPDLGSIRIGGQADLVVWDFDNPAHIASHFASAPHARFVLKKGKVVHEGTETGCFG